MTENRSRRLLRDWRQRRRLSQLDLALEAGISTRHLSFVETGRAKPSPEMVLHLAEQLEVPLRDRNQLLLAAGYAPRFGERTLDDPEMAPVRDALGRVLSRTRAVSGDRRRPRLESGRLQRGARGRCWRASRPSTCSSRPVNCLRLALHPEGLAPRILNLGDWRAHLLERLTRQIALTGDERLLALEAELRSYPGPPPGLAPAGDEIMVELRLAGRDDEELAFFSTVTTFGTAVDITLSELSMEAFFPADATTARALQDLAAVA